MAGNVDGRAGKKLAGRKRPPGDRQRRSSRGRVGTGGLDLKEVDNAPVENRRPEDLGGPGDPGGPRLDSRPVGDRQGADGGAPARPSGAGTSRPTSTWGDWINWGLGLWLCLSPTILSLGGDAATLNAVATGYLLMLAEVATLTVFRVWEEGIVIAIGMWLISSPFILDVPAVAAKANFVVVGLAVTALAWHQIRAALRLGRGVLQGPSARGAGDADPPETPQNRTRTPEPAS